jgi:O-antigen/teichoic acid export membrane protein
MFKYSGSNYLGTIFSIMPGFVLPLFITYYLGAEQTAYFYISWMIANLLFFIPNSVGKSFLSEGSYDLIKTDFKSALKFSYLINIAGVILALIMGKFILSFFGTSYVENCLSLLYILVISSLFYSYNILIVMYYNLHHKVGKVIFIYATIAIITFILSYLLIDWGLLGIGFSWIVANLVLNVILFWREK